LLEAVEEVGAHGADYEQRTLAVLQRAGEQGVELLARCRVGKGEQFLELVDDQQESRLFVPGPSLTTPKKHLSESIGCGPRGCRVALQARNWRFS
jgi:hypothetical protein